MRHNGAVSTPNFAGAVDLGALAAQKDQQRKTDAAIEGAPAGLIIDATAANFQTEVMDRSMTNNLLPSTQDGGFLPRSTSMPSNRSLQRSKCNRFRRFSPSSVDK